MPEHVSLAALTALPVEEAIPRLRAALAAHAAAVLEAPPGAGKTTLVPLRLLDEPWLAGRRILVLEPRRLAARGAAARMAELLGEEPGETVGYAMRFERRVGQHTRIEVVTEGLLTRRLQRDPMLEAYGLVVFDEFHERSLDADLGLALCLEVQESLRPDLKLLVMSATLDGAATARLLGDVPVVRSEGRLFPVRVEHLAGDPGEALELHVARAVQEALAASSGSILVFLPGAGEIRRAEALLRDRLRDPAIAIHPLYGDLPRAAQDAAIRPAPSGRRKIVLATNIAETSLTIEGVAVVIDAGLERRARFSPRTGMSRLVTVPISRASAEQRKGRAGRLGPGICYRLWPPEEDRGRREHRPAEIEEADLAPLALELAVWGVRDPAALRLPTRPPVGPFQQARELLRELEALDASGAVTPHGRAMAELPLHPRLAHMVLRARERGMAGTALAVAALLSGRDSDRDRSDADLVRRVELLGRGAGATREAERIRRQLGRALGGEPGEARAEAVGAVTALAYPDRLAQARGGPGSFRLANGRGARLDPLDPLAKEPWLAVAELDDAGAEARIRLAAPLSLATVEALFGERFTTEEEVRFDPREAAVTARRVTRLGALVVKEQALTAIDPERVAAALCQGIRAKGLVVLPWSDAARQLRARVAFLRRREPECWPDLDDPALLAGLEEWLAPWLAGRRRLVDLADIDLQAILKSRLDHAQWRELERRAPARLPVPSGREIAIDYTADPPVLAVKLQELFGLAVTPAVDEGRVKLSLQLLSPAQRPVAVTRDLAGFWVTGYPAVRKELRGRYPKHPWPEDPLTAPATHKAKPRA
ncbi:ATP-dependent helicase HrpB [Benzoatithermus flavus]|uniref:ATP-dependent helicase HrpB n=1 Tax=Benzoatithermus flavus TaxID=3108223 RepID=A0ABU8XMW2_9PROT